MTGVQETFTAEKIEELRKNIDFSDIPELTSMEGFILKNFKPTKNGQGQLISADPFYSPENIAELERRIKNMKKGKELVEHDLIEVE